MSAQYPRVASFADAGAFRARLQSLGIPLPCDDAPLGAPHSPLAAPLELAGGRWRLSNRFVVQPMEGWDGTADGRPTELTRRRWQRFGRSGAAWVWGGEAVAVAAAGRANPNQLLLVDATAPALGALRRDLLAAAGEVGNEPLVGLQLTHSGRWARPDARGPAPRIAFRHPLLDRRVGIADDRWVLSDDDVVALIGRFARAAHLAQEEGFAFVDLKHCHGYLLHEFLAACTRPGRYGGEALAGRTRVLEELVAAVRAAAPRLALGVRLSVFDAVPHRPDGVDASGRLGPGRAEPHEVPYRWAFGLHGGGDEQLELEEPLAVVRLLVGLGIDWINVTAGSPYYVSHLQRPAAFPPSDGYAPPEDPLAGVARLLRAARAVKDAVAEAVVISSGWSYLQEYLPHVAQACVRAGWFDAVGLGRMMLAYPELPADVLAGRPLDRRRLCRTFSDCTTAPRQGMVSGCYPLDPFYRQRPERVTLEAGKRRTR